MAIRINITTSGVVNEQGVLTYKTGQTISSVTGDDGDTQAGVDFWVCTNNGLVVNNPFGNKWRFTGIAGGYWDRDTNQYKLVDGTVTTRALAYPNGLRVDWMSESNSHVNIFIATSLGGNTFEYLCENINSELAVVGFRAVNKNELINLHTYENGGLDNPEFWDGFSSRPVCSSTSIGGAPLVDYCMAILNNEIQPMDKNYDDFETIAIKRVPITDIIP